MAATLPGVFEEGLREKILKSKVLVVGAGGIGCEILKNLVLSGFPYIEIIDLDTIDVSNLNRQFLFHKEHVGKSKAQVAKESALSFNPDVEIKAYHDSITTTNYGVNFFQQFDVVLNALDNRQARNHVNRMCLTADVPLIESGTAGYNGQVELIKKGLTQCYECTPKAAQKSFPGCTIRNTPSEPIHCIVWAKHLFNQLFGETNEDEEVSPDTADPEAAGEAGTDALATEANDKGNIERVNTRQWAQLCQYDGEKLFNKFFHDDIKYLLSMSNLWKNRVPPTPLTWDDTNSEDKQPQDNQESLLPDQRIWPIAECAKIFAESAQNLRIELSKLPENDHLVWDKDDKSAMDFVASCANIRAHIFNITRKSRFDIKSMAGNIIPAIATTNAITAGIVVMHAFKVLEGEIDKCKSVYMRLRPNARNQLFVPDKDLNPPNPKCYVCSPKPEVLLKIDTNKVTAKELRDDVLIKALNMVDPDVILDVKGVIVISSEEGETECNNDKKLSELQIVNGSILKVDDFFQKYELSITVVHIDAKHDEPLFEVVGDPDSLKPAEATEENGKTEVDINKNGDGPSDAKRVKLDSQTTVEENVENAGATTSGLASEAVEDDDDLCIVEEDDTEDTPASSSGNSSNAVQTAVKRKPADGGEGPSSAKRAKVVGEVDDEDDDLILIDD